MLTFHHSSFRIHFIFTSWVCTYLPVYADPLNGVSRPLDARRGPLLRAAYDDAATQTFYFGMRITSALVAPIRARVERTP